MLKKEVLLMVLFDVLGVTFTTIVHCYQCESFLNVLDTISLDDIEVGGFIKLLLN